MQPTSIKIPRFLVDTNVGRLATWLRVMGYDTVFLRDGDDNELIRSALREDRIIVTRDTGFKDRYLETTGRLEVVLIRGSDFRSQLQELVASQNLESRPEFSRCIRCNVALVCTTREQVKERVPSYVSQTQSNFTTCPACDQVYCQGTHWKNMNAELAQLGIEGR